MVSKKEIQNKVQESVSQAIHKIEANEPSKKTQKIIKKSSKKLASTIKKDLKKIAKKNEKLISKSKSKTPKAKDGKKKVEIVA
jgi:arginyl-tRNA synthetase